MDRWRRPSLASSQPAPAKPEAPKLRRKLQKFPKLRSQESKRTTSATPNGSLPERPPAILAVTQAQTQPSLPLPPDLSTFDWPENTRRNGFVASSRASTQSNKPSPNASTRMVPELSYLARKGDPRLRGPPTPPESPSSSSSMISRRQAKTPVFAIGQLEGRPQEQQAVMQAADNNKSRAELFAEEYRALLASRNSMLSDSRPESSQPQPQLQLPPSPQSSTFGEGRRFALSTRGSDRSQSRPPPSSASQLAELPAELPANCSPASEDRTLVSFQEEAVYFKPFSMPGEPEPHTPLRSRGAPPAYASPEPDNLSLQICLDLLTKELSSAATDRPNRNGSKLSALQIWVMIEAYERLHDQLVSSQLREDETRTMKAMLDTWLRALYALHDSLSAPPPADSRYVPRGPSFDSDESSYYSSGARRGGYAASDSGDSDY